MPSIVSVTLIPKRVVAYALPSSGRIAQAILMDAFKAFSEELGRKVHSQDPTPYSVSRVTTSKKRITGITAVVPPSDYMRATFKLLRDDLLDPLVEGLFKAKLLVNGIEVEVADASIRRVNYLDLLTKAPLAKGVTFRFLTPVLDFKEFPPTASKVLSRAIRAWNAFSGANMGDFMRNRLLWAVPTSMALESDAVKVSFRGRDVVFVGYRGRVSYSFRLLTSQEGRFASALSVLAEFTGVGDKTTMGFGVTKVKLWK